MPSVREVTPEHWVAISRSRPHLPHIVRVIRTYTPFGYTCTCEQFDPEKGNKGTCAHIQAVAAAIAQQ